MTNQTASQPPACAHCGARDLLPGHLQVCKACGKFVVRVREYGIRYGDCCARHKLTALAWGLRDGSLDDWKKLVNLTFRQRTT